ncbi:FHA domain-containing protein [Actinomyces dentalis]|uniref:FHA domain-containing protein n=1 Tax=Actinomyces dentalis TaxID=272548 RepID=UPI0028E9E2B1|nr:FHA domain-containing protein [Actinomyces dentalis]
MLQIGRYSYRGTGAVMVAGPLGVALVPPEWAKGAREALIGRAEIVAWLTQVSQAGADAAVLDLAGPQAHLSLLGRAWVRALAPGLAEAQEWQAPVWGWALNPGDWECLDVELGVAEAERTVGEWRLATEDLVDARSLRIGRALREETDRFERPFELPQAGASSEALGASRLAEYRDGESGALGGSRRAARIRDGESPGGPGAQGGGAEVVWSAADGEAGREPAGAKPRHLWVPPDPTQPSGLRLRTRTRAAGPRHRRVSEPDAEALVEPSAASPERALRRRGRRVAEPVARTPEQASGSAASPESTDTPVVGWTGLAAPDAPAAVPPEAGSSERVEPVAEPAGPVAEPFEPVVESAAGPAVVGAPVWTESAGTPEKAVEPVGSAEVPAPLVSAGSPEPAVEPAAGPVVPPEAGSSERVGAVAEPAGAVAEPVGPVVESAVGSPERVGTPGSADSAGTPEGAVGPVGSAEVPALLVSAGTPGSAGSPEPLTGSAGTPGRAPEAVESPGSPGSAAEAAAGPVVEPVGTAGTPEPAVGSAGTPGSADSAGSPGDVVGPVGSAEVPAPLVSAGTPGSAGSPEPLTGSAGTPEPAVEPAAGSAESPEPGTGPVERVERVESAGTPGRAPEPAAPAESPGSPEPAAVVEPGPDSAEWSARPEPDGAAEPAVGAPWDAAEPDPEPLVEWTPFSPAEPFTNRRTGFFSQGLTSSEPPANMGPAAYDSPEDNPELYEATLTPEALARMRQEESATGDTIMRRVPAAAPATPSAFLIYAGSAPVEVVRDVIIGRDPNTRVLTGRPMAAPLRVPSPGSEISRSHCAVMATAPGVWSLMDLASVNGSILVHPDGSSEDAPAMVGVPLADGDLIDLGEGVTVEFRVR